MVMIKFSKPVVCRIQEITEGRGPQLEPQHEESLLRRRESAGRTAIREWAGA